MHTGAGPTGSRRHDVVVHGDDLTADRRDDLLGQRQLPSPRVARRGLRCSVAARNMAATSRLQGDMKSAHSHAREGLELLAEGGDRLAYLWGFKEGALVLMADISLMDYLRFVLSWNP